MSSRHTRDLILRSPEHEVVTARDSVTGEQRTILALLIPLGIDGFVSPESNKVTHQAHAETLHPLVVYY